ncbi:MAG TPA: flippase [Candidatus Eisenbacteria bacterium]
MGNAGINLITQGVLVLVYVLATPGVVHGLGDSGYGTLAVLVVVLGYFGVLDLGVSQATVKFVSSHLAREEVADVRRVVGTSLVANLALGVTGGIAIASLGPRALIAILHLQGAARAEIGPALLLLGAALPFVLVQGTLQGVAGAHQRFLEINLISGAAAALQPLSALVLVRLGFGLTAVVLAYVVLRVLSAATFAIVLGRIEPELRLRPAFDRATFTRLLRFGGWVLVSSVVGPIMVNADRALIGWLLSAAAVTYYAVPNDVAGRLLIVSGSLTSVLFPAFSMQASAAPADDPARAPGAASLGLLLRSAKLLLIVLVPAVVLLGAFAPDLFRIWMGAEFARRSPVVLQLLAAGVLVNSLAAMPYTALWGMGRPDVTAKFHLLELPLYLGACMLLIPRAGIEGAAIAWLLRVSLDLGLLVAAIRRLTGLTLRRVAESRFPRALLLGAGLAALAVAVGHSGLGLAARLAITLALVLAYAALAWRAALDAVDRGALTRVLARAPGAAAGARDV